MASHFGVDEHPFATYFDSCSPGVLGGFDPQPHEQSKEEYNTINKSNNSDVVAQSVRLFNSLQERLRQTIH